MEIIIVLVFLLILIIVTVYIAMQKKDITEDTAMPTIHASGIYSVIRKSPRENIYTAKEYNVSKAPAIYLYKNNALVDKIEGYDKDLLAEKVKSLMK